MVSFSNDAETAMAANDAPSDFRLRANASKSESSLTKSSKAWDLDGDGQLDEAELALKQRDKEGTGTLSNDELYKLMNENLKVQRDLFQMKKVLIGLTAFTFLLALSNLGTSFAAAILSKDTKSQGAVLTESKTGMAMKTDTYSNIFHNDPEEDARRRRQRKLACEAKEDGGIGCDSDVVNSNEHSMSVEDGLEMLRLCEENGSDVDLQFTVGDDVFHYCVCPPTAGEAHYHKENNVVVSADITNTVGTFHIRIDENGNHYTVTW